MLANAPAPAAIEAAATTSWRIFCGDAVEQLRALEAGSAQTCVTSPPYWNQRDYGMAEQLGLEPTPELYVQKLVAVFREVRRVLADDGTLWINIGDSYVDRANCRSDGQSHRRDRRDVVPPKINAVGNGRKAKDLLGLPWMVAFALRNDGWYLRKEVIWEKDDALSESVRDRPMNSHEQLFLLSKRPSYYYDLDAIREPYATAPRRGDRKRHPGGRNRRSVWRVPATGFAGSHFATFPPDLIEPCVLAGAAPGDTVLDPFAGSGTTGMVALRHDRSFVGIELNPEYVEIGRRRITDDAPLFNVPCEAAA
jgi:site-specific DNA-methyltransferase (adenine-specific)